MFTLRIILLIVLAAAAAWGLDQLRKTHVKTNSLTGLDIRLGTLNVGDRDYIDAEDLIRVLQHTLASARKVRLAREAARGGPETES